MTIPIASRRRGLLLGAILLAPLVGCCLAWGALNRCPKVRADGNATSRKQLIELEQAYVEAYNRRDGTWLDQHTSEDYLFTADQDQTLGKWAFIALITSIPAGITGATTVEVVETYGDCGIVVATFTDRVPGQPDRFERFTETCVRRHGRWYFAAIQTTSLGGG